jgi:hypothetical protein
VVVDEEQSSPTATSIGNISKRKFSRGSFSPFKFIQALNCDMQIKDYSTSQTPKENSDPIKTPDSAIILKLKQIQL